MLRQRGVSPQGHPRPSAYQLAARHLLYRADLPWRDMPIDVAVQHMQEAMPPHLHEAWRAVNNQRGGMLPCLLYTSPSPRDSTSS
eukprot:5745191-Prorocentrum_lima.AAC.1